MNDFDFIESVKNMKSISEICKEYGIDYSNLTCNRTTQENVKKVADRLKIEIYKIYAILTFIESEKAKNVK